MITVITGGSRGIGAAAVRAFTAAGHQVYFLYHRSSEAAQALAAQTGAVALQADVADEDAVQAAFAQIPSVDNLICNAGIAHYGLISEISGAEWDRLFAVNVKGIYHCVRAALPHFLRRQAGCIVTVSSMWGQAGASCEAAYSATKGAVIALTKSLAKELAPSGVRVNCIAPGVIQTEMLSNLTPQDLQVLAEETPLCRLGQPEEVAAVMRFLTSDSAAFLTGQVIGLDGGYLL
jgi:3-oxoacyl-[acyl-carrier protein] reductase